VAAQVVHFPLAKTFPSGHLEQTLAFILHSEQLESQSTQAEVSML